MSSLNRYLVFVLSLIGLFTQIQAGATPNDGSGNIFGASDRDFSTSYKRISSYLTEHVRTDEIESNMKAAIAWLSENLKKDLPDNERLNDALKLFISLKETLNGKKCDQSGYKILFANLLATEQRGRRKRSEYRTDRIVYQFCLDHARNCNSKYPMNFNEIYSKMDPTMRQRVEFFLNDENLQDFLRGAKDRSEYYRSLLMNQDRIEGKNGAFMAYKTIKALSINDKDREYLTANPQTNDSARKGKIKELFERYVLKPCEYFVDKLGPDIYEPSRFDAMFSHLVREVNWRYYNSWARFRICTYVIDNEDTFTSRLANGKVA